jgi:AcrR family transcriptional regulator
MFRDSAWEIALVTPPLDAISLIRNRPRRTQKERSAETRTALIEAMMAALADVGYSRTTTAEITGRAGLTTGALQHHFRSKEDLILAVLDHQFEEVRDELEVFAEKYAGKAGRLRNEWRSLIQVLSNIFGGPRYLAVWEIILGTRGDKELHAAVLQHRVKSLAILEKLWFRVFGQIDGNDRHISDLMHFTLATLRGFVFYSAIEPDPAFFERQHRLLENFLASAVRR